MDRTYWHRQTKDNPLYPDLLWSRPENKNQAGKLLIVGGSAHGFAAPAEAYGAAEQAGAGTVRVLLPDKLKKTVGRAFAAGEFAPSTPSGSFGQQALGTLLEASEWADGVLLAGDFGHNSETAILVEKFIDKCAGQLTLAQDALDYFISSPDDLLNRGDALLVATFSQLQKLAQGAHFPQAFTADTGLLKLAENLHGFTNKFSVCVITSQLENIIVAAGGQVSTTKIDKQPNEITLATHAAVWWLQNPTTRFEAITTAIINLGQ